MRIENLGWWVVIMQVIVQSKINMLPNARVSGACPLWKLWKTDHLRLNLRAFQGYSHACYISYMTIWMLLLYSCCVGGSGIYIYICISYNTGKSALPQGSTAPEGECVYIYARRLRVSAYISGNARVPVL